MAHSVAADVLRQYSASGGQGDGIRPTSAGNTRQRAGRPTSGNFRRSTTAVMKSQRPPSETHQVPTTQQSSLELLEKKYDEVREGIRHTKGVIIELLTRQELAQQSHERVKETVQKRNREAKELLTQTRQALPSCVDKEAIDYLADIEKYVEELCHETAMARVAGGTDYRLSSRNDKILPETSNGTRQCLQRAINYNNKVTDRLIERLIEAQQAISERESTYQALKKRVDPIIAEINTLDNEEVEAANTTQLLVEEEGLAARLGQRLSDSKALLLNTQNSISQRLVERDADRRRYASYLDDRRVVAQILQNLGDAHQVIALFNTEISSNIANAFSRLYNAVLSTEHLQGKFAGSKNCQALSTALSHTFERNKLATSRQQEATHLSKPDSPLSSSELDTKIRLRFAQLSEKLDSQLRRSAMTLEPHYSETGSVVHIPQMRTATHVGSSVRDQVN
ncbi:hypothetical protein GMRT_14297 [Giardia muris]|uniref:Uncharacterized protein n=1 Tax=Giardia muris TaxID=5742 RepID=A0A4Z1SWG9_GIAMU|nr:hypothetical protein GMRT_14297 [Giardia muris]|eukprot:TNJ30162.1 hypothetical protein GMRT_14297 [Giardia muris]